MTLTVFLAICILGCDLLIYFLYEWAFGESKRLRRRRSQPRIVVNSTETAMCRESRMSEKRSPVARVAEMNRKPENAVARSAQPDAHEERLAYRRLALSFIQLKTRV
jgi:hypothetical protein